MKRPIFVRPLADAERDAVAVGLRSSHAFTLRRSQIIAASARGEPVPRIARSRSCDQQTVRNAIHAFDQEGVAALTKRSCAVHTAQAAFTPATAEALRALLHRSPRAFGHPTSLWTLDLAAEEAHRRGLTAARVTGEPIRATLVRLGVRWLRAKTWSTSPDPAYARKKGGAPGGSAGRLPTPPGSSGSRTRSGVAAWPRPPRPPCTPGRAATGPCGWWNRRSPRATPTSRRWPATAC